MLNSTHNLFISMGKCEFGEYEKEQEGLQYYYYENNNLISYRCFRDVILDKHYCKFHDFDY